MQYKHAVENKNYEDYSSGRVLYGYSGATNFPVRLTQEIFERCLSYLNKQNILPPYTIYDPFCGVAYSLTIIGLLYPGKIKPILASDINQESLNFAEKNLSLLSSKGLDKRITEITSLIEEHKKNSHKEALESALRIKENLKSDVSIKVFTEDILNTTPSILGIDIVICDVPYGNLTEWSTHQSINPTQQFLNNIKNILSTHSILAISANKKQEITHDGYTKIETFKIGKRKILFLIPNIVT
jgi:23S rRNA (guanine2535-N1)-methyltransferase